ncbi:efflux RND transporter periplasmic adaptor subunit [Leptospira stimsonii]|uniref:HlyD family efflux transporter periplasmic adaptor subunit n=1 Tax=Leptospira stimsonii TaxID=2202203 RepID=A0A4R9L1E6_9LEPT|nr:efflux RND transporter periplasmic adaptor subunit [Leptospira stimsonii]RHX86415.1 secretion protein HlyD [Leptospira stimsonii]TGK14464.1 HlyD family efflux transporter periplasmic adaptor subunit [Leptospira stimsonii]TGM11828.1 HlyD family efflux transporter periplasmic adaptor subunit [Leptospira stimsonii]
MNKALVFIKLIWTSRLGRIASIGVLIVLLAFGSYLVIREKRTEVSPKVGPIVELVYSLGTVKSDRVYHLKLGVTSSIRKIFVKEGEMVKEGQELLISDSGSNFRAPFSGTVTSVPFQEGEVVMPGAPVLTMMDLKKTYILLSLDQDSVLRIRPGQRAELSFETIRGTKVMGKVNRVYPSDGQFYVRVDVESMPEGTLPEMTADVAVEVARKENALLIPVKSVEKGKIRVRRNGKILLLDAKVGAVDGEWCEVLENVVLETDTVYLDGGR